MKVSMNSSVAAASRVTRILMMGLVAAVVMMYGIPAVASTQVNLHGPHVGADSTTFNVEGDAGGLTDPVVWHFVLNQLDMGTESGTIYVTFQSAGLKTASGIPVGNGMLQHFYVGTPDHDVILGAYAMVDSEGYGLLVLSHVALGEPPGEEPPGEEPPGEEPPGEEPPGEEPPGEEPPGEEPPGEEPPGEEPPGEEPPGEEPPGVEEEPFLPFTEDEDPVTKAEEEPFLPFTGGPVVMLLGAAAAAAAGTALRRIGM